MLTGCAASGYTVFSDARIFSDDIIFSAQIAGGRAVQAHSRMLDLLGEIDAEVSLSKPNSDLCRFNASGADERVEVGAHTYALFDLALEYYTLTNGAFNCAVTPLTKLWRVDSASDMLYSLDGYGTDDVAALPTLSETDAVKAHCDPYSVTASEENGKYYLTKTDDNVKLDFGGIAKGYAVDKCVGILDEYDIASALIDISGNAFFYGGHIKGGDTEAWSVGVISPRPRSGQTLSRGYAAALSLTGDVSAVTSGDYMRYRIATVGDRTLYIPHIVKPNGMPVGIEYSDGEYVQSDEWVISATVIGENSGLCDALSTAVVALGLEEGCELLQKIGYKGLIFTEKRYTIIGDVTLYKPNEYNGFREYTFYEH